ncbi:MAG: hypothetical protein ACRDNS_17775, partial [Trebonia sp.]
GRALVSVAPTVEAQFIDLCAEHGVSRTRIGIVDALAPGLDVRGQFEIGRDELRAAWSATLPGLFE